jgi:choline kinase
LKSIILAAGEGRRLRPLTENNPKCMVNLFGKSLLQRQIEVMKSCGIDEIVIVTGYKSEMIKFPDIHYVRNENYEYTNMVKTLFCAKKELVGNIIISYGDIIYEKSVLQKLINAKTDISVIIDKNWKMYWNERFENPLNDAESLKINAEGNISEIGQCVNSFDDIQGQYIGLMKFNYNGTEILKQFYDNCKNNSKNGLNVLNSTIPFEKSYMTDLLQGLINAGHTLKPLMINGGWLELDTIEDYKLYQEMYKKNRLGKFINLEK